MKAKSVYINLPVKDLQKSRKFWSVLGFSFNEKFSDDKAACLVLNEGAIYAMLITHAMFKTFTDRPIADSSSTQVLLAFEVDSRATVDKVEKLAVDNGGKRYKDATDHGWMYYDCFADPDGHQWEVLYTDESKIPA